MNFGDPNFVINTKKSNIFIFPPNTPKNKLWRDTIFLLEGMLCNKRVRTEINLFQERLLINCIALLGHDT